MIVETYVEAFISEITCCEWFQCHKSENVDMQNKQCPRLLKKFEDMELEALLNEDPCQT